MEQQPTQDATFIRVDQGSRPRERLWTRTIFAVIVVIMGVAACGDDGPPKEIKVNGRTCISTPTDLDCDFGNG